MEELHSNLFSKCSLSDNLKKYISHILNIDLTKFKKTIKVLMLCNWCTSEQLCNNWNKMSKGNRKWNDIEIISIEDEDKVNEEIHLENYSDNFDYVCIINKPNKFFVLSDEIKKKTIVFQMEPYMWNNEKMWGEWAKPDPTKFKKVFTHTMIEHNNFEWHISKTYNELISSAYTIVKDTNYDTVVSTVLSAKYTDPGHIKRIDFVKKNEDLFHVFGDNKFNYKNYKRSLPYGKKDDALLPYKYTFNCENNFYPGYVTEKLIDGILSECLVFYSGATNINSIIDERCFINLNLANFKKCKNTIIDCINNNEWEKRIEFIRKEKKRILNTEQFFPVLERCIKDLKSY